MIKRYIDEATSSDKKKMASILSSFSANHKAFLKCIEIDKSVIPFAIETLEMFDGEYNRDFIDDKVMPGVIREYGDYFDYDYLKIIDVLIDEKLTKKDLQMISDNLSVLAEDFVNIEKSYYPLKYIKDKCVNYKKFVTNLKKVFKYKISERMYQELYNCYNYDYYDSNEDFDVSKKDVIEIIALLDKIALREILKSIIK